MSEKSSTQRAAWQAPRLLDLGAQLDGVNNGGSSVLDSGSNSSSTSGPISA